jgi:hypothetical protein
MCTHAYWSHDPASHLKTQRKDDKPYHRRRGNIFIDKPKLHVASCLDHAQTLYAIKDLRQNG